MSTLALINWTMRCVLCAKCARFSKEIVDDDVLGFVDRVVQCFNCSSDKPLAVIILLIQ